VIKIHLDGNAWGAVVGPIGVSFDVTQRELMEDKLRASVKSAFLHSCNTFPGAAWVKDCPGHYMYTTRWRILFSDD
jgi:hypothetical protein